MPYLWLPPEIKSSPWRVVDLTACSATALELRSPLTLLRSREVDVHPWPRLLAGHDNQTWLILDGFDVRVSVNGRPISGIGARVLRDRDSLALVGQSIDQLAFFSAERRVIVESIAHQPRHVRCPRCRAGFEQQAQSVVRCPSCGVLYHQANDRRCWTGPAEQPFETCTSCGAAVREEGAFQWNPTQFA